MVLNQQLQVTSLYELSVQVVSKKLFKFIKEHCTSCEFCSVCKTEKCSAIIQVIEMLKLPENIRNSVYDEVQGKIKQLAASTKLDSDTNLQYLLLSLLKANEGTSVKIKHFELRNRYKDTTFISTFGKNINSLLLAENIVVSVHDGWQDDDPTMSEMSALLQQLCVPGNQISNDASSRHTYDITACYVCRFVLRSTINIQVLALHWSIKLNDELFETIGRECVQLKVLKRVRVKAEDGVTVQSFRKLLFHTDDDGITHRNKCCDTLESIMFLIREYDPSMNEILDLLLPNLPNLKFLGNQLNLEHYLEHLTKGGIYETALDDIHFAHLTRKNAEILNVFSPNVRKLYACRLESGAVQSLSSLKYLESINVYESKHIIVSELFTSHWCNLKEVLFEADDYFSHLDVDLVAKNLPLLTRLFIGISRVSWSGNTYFNRLQNGTFVLEEYNNISWIASFASTAESVLVCSPNAGTMTLDYCEVLVTVPFPNLKYLYIDHFPFDFQFYSKVLGKLPKLEVCKIYDNLETEEEKAQHLEELSQFMETKFIQCELESSIPEYGLSEVISMLETGEAVAM